MSLTGTPLQLSYGLRPLNPVPVDWLSGPFTGNSLADALTAANNAITPSLRFRSMEVRIVVGPDTYKYWYYGGTANSDLVEFSPTVPQVNAEGPIGAVQFNDGGSFSGSNDLLYNSTSRRLVLGSDVLLQFGDGTTQGTARNFFSLTGATSARFPRGVSGVGNTGDRLLVATGASSDPFKSYVRFGNSWFQTGVVGIGQGPQGIQGTAGNTGPRGATGERGATGAKGETGVAGERGSTGNTGERGETGATGAAGERGVTGATGARGETGSFTGNYVSSINGLSGSVSLTAGTNVSIGIAGSVITISASGGSAETTWGRTDPTTTTVGGVASGSTFDVTTNAIQVLHQILYPYVSVAFTSFSSGLNGTYELGQTAGNGTFTTNWTTSGPNANWIPNSAFIRYSGLASGTALTGGSPTALSASVTYPAFRSTTIAGLLSIQITGAQQQGSQPSRTATSQWWSRMYWGKSTNPSLTDPLSLLGGSSKLITFTGSQTPPHNADGDGYLYLFLHNTYTLTQMTYAGFDVSLNAPSVQAVTNAHGFTTNYKIYRSTFELPGSLQGITIAIS